MLQFAIHACKRKREEDAFGGTEAGKSADSGAQVGVAGNKKSGVERIVDTGLDHRCGDGDIRLLLLVGGHLLAGARIAHGFLFEVTLANRDIPCTQSADKGLVPHNLFRVLVVQMVCVGREIFDVVQLSGWANDVHVGRAKRRKVQPFHRCVQVFFSLAHGMVEVESVNESNHTIWPEVFHAAGSHAAKDGKKKPPGRNLREATRPWD